MPHVVRRPIATARANAGARLIAVFIREMNLAFRAIGGQAKSSGSR